MKKFISLLLALCLVLALAACGGGNDDPKPTETKPSETKPTETKPTEAQNPYKGTEIEVWGVDVSKFADITTVNAGDFLDCVLVAMVEWGAANEVTIKWGGSYTQARYMAAVAGGQTPDLILTYGAFPTFANLGITKGMSAEGAAAIAEVAGEGYVTANSYKGQYHGMLLPVNGNEVFWYNMSKCEELGVKTPKEYWEEGKWTWDNMIQFWKDCTKDVDGDGVFDYVGTCTNDFVKLGGEFAYAQQNADGTLSSVAETERYRYFADMCYTGVTEGWILPGTGDIWSLTKQPYPITRLGDCELYNPHHTNWTLDNGDICEVVPLPKYKESEAQMNTRLSFTLYICSSNDNMSATEAMLVYVQKCCIKFMADVSQGAVKTDFEGMKGTTPLSKLWLERHAVRLADDKAYVKELTDAGVYDAEHVAKLWDYLIIETPSSIPRTYSGVNSPYYPVLNNEKMFGYLFTEPAATSVPKVIAAHKAEVQKYNDTYAF